MPSAIQGPELSLRHVDRSWEGRYLCTADNGIGQPDTAQVTLHVEFPPEVKAVKVSDL